LGASPDFFFNFLGVFVSFFADVEHSAKGLPSAQKIALDKDFFANQKFIV